MTISRQQRFITRRRITALLSLLVATAAHADENAIDRSKAVFVLIAGSRRVLFIDPDTDRIAGAIDVGVVPQQVELASSISKLLAIDGTTTRINVVDLISGEIVTQQLDFVPGRLTVSSDGLTVAIADKETGAIVLLDLLRRRTTSSVAGRIPLRDMVFSVDSRTLYVAGGNEPDIGVVDAATAHLYSRISTGLPHGSATLTRSPNGRQLFVQSSSGGSVGILDLEHRTPLAPIQTAPGSTVAFPSATGAYLLIADNQAGTLTVLHGDDAPAVLQAATGVSTIYTAWFDTLALVPSTTTNTVLLYDLEARRPAGTNPLASSPGRGAVTPDGRKFYLPLPDARQVAVIDARLRKLVASIPMPGMPSTVLLAGSYGVCH